MIKARADCGVFFPHCRSTFRQTLWTNEKYWLHWVVHLNCIWINSRMFLCCCFCSQNIATITTNSDENPWTLVCLISLVGLIFGRWGHAIGSTLFYVGISMYYMVTVRQKILIKKSLKIVTGFFLCLIWRRFVYITVWLFQPVYLEEN